MANFGFATTGPRRNPTADERANGFPCGGADQLLFNGLHHRTEAELLELLTFAGITPTDNDFTQVRQAVQALIDAATGGGEETGGYLLLSQAASRLPIFPEFQTADGRVIVTSPANGTVRIPAGVTFMHRGIVPITTTQLDFATVSSRTYHLRWNPTDGYALKNVGDSGYNPSALPDGDKSFDSTFDDMLIARIVTNSSNVATITNLANKDRMETDGYTLAPGPFTVVGADNSVNTQFDVTTIDWARRPRFVGLNAVLGAGSTFGSGGGLDGQANQILEQNLDRYKLNIKVTSDFTGTTSGHYANARWSLAV